MKPLKILATPVDNGGCGHYRVRQPFSMITQHTDSEAYVVDMEKIHKEEYLRGVTMAVDQADIVVSRPTGGIESGFMDMLRKQPELANKKVVLDIDDNPEMISPYSAHYMEFGIEEYFDRNENKLLWKDGVDGFNLTENRLRMSKMIEDLTKADMISVTTKRLAKYAKKYNKNVVILPNLIDTTKWWKIDTKPHKTIRIALQGGYSHYADWELVRAPLSRILREFDVVLVMVGYDYRGILDKDVQHKVEAQPWVDFTAHSYRMMALDLDIAVIPLDDDSFNQNKSSIKFYEFSAMAVPSIVSNVLPYKEDINESNSVPFKTDEELYKSLKMLIENEQLRQDIGFNAQKWVVENRNAKSEVNMWLDAYNSLL